MGPVGEQRRAGQGALMQRWPSTSPLACALASCPVVGSISAGCTPRKGSVALPGLSGHLPARAPERSGVGRSGGRDGRCGRRRRWRVRLRRARVWLWVGGMRACGRRGRICSPQSARRAACCRMRGTPLRAWQRGEHCPARLRLPPRVDDGTLPLAHDAVVPAPGLGVDRLAHRPAATRGRHWRTRMRARPSLEEASRCCGARASRLAPCRAAGRQRPSARVAPTRDAPEDAKRGEVVLEHRSVARAHQGS